MTMGCYLITQTEKKTFKRKSCIHCVLKKMQIFDVLHLKEDRYFTIYGNVMDVKAYCKLFEVPRGSGSTLLFFETMETDNTRNIQ